MDLIEKELPSGAKLRITLANFEVGKDLWQTMVRVNGASKLDIVKMLSSKEVEQAIWRCMDRVLYNGVKVDKDTFEPVEARQDYLIAMFLVATENLEPFTKALV